MKDTMSSEVDVKTGESQRAGRKMLRRVEDPWKGTHKVKGVVVAA